MASNNPTAYYISLPQVTDALRQAVCTTDSDIDINFISQLVDRYKELNYRLQNPNRYRYKNRNIGKPNGKNLPRGLRNAMGLEGGTKKRCYGKNKMVNGVNLK